jgi:Transglutaminase-like superfamily
VTRRNWAGAILLAWIVSIGWLLKRELFPPTGARLAEAALSVPPGATYYRLEVAGQQVGFASSTIDTLGTSIRVTDVLVLQVPALGALHRTTVLSRATLSRALRLEGVDVKFAGEPGRFAARGLVTGDSVLRLTLLTPTDSATTRVPLAHSIVLPTIVPLRLAFGGELKAGRTYTLATFDPVLLEQRQVRVTVAAESTLAVPDSAGYDSTAMAWVPVHFDTLRAFRIEEESGGATTSAWIDAQGHIVRTVSPVGFTMTRSAFETAYENFRHRDTTRAARASAEPGRGDVIATTAIAAGAPLRPDRLALLRVRFSGATPPAAALGTATQQLVGDTLVVRRASEAAMVARYRLPARDTALARVLAPAPLIESDDPRLQAQARLILAGERDPARAARRIHDWVSAHVERQVTPGPPSAVRVLEARRGDCNEHTVLYVALARAAGLPARTVAGLVYLGGRFYYHAWPEVWLGDWVAVDPTLDQAPADAAHVRFVVDGLARQAELVRLIGGLKLEVL